MFAMGLRLRDAKPPMYIAVLTGLRLPGGIYTLTLAPLNHALAPHLPPRVAPLMILSATFLSPCASGTVTPC